jgi:hypothetical protein
MYGDLIEDVNSETPDESTSTSLRAKELANALSHLNPRMRRVLALASDSTARPRRPWKKSASGWEHARARPPTRVPRLTRVAHSNTGLELYLSAE